MKYFLLSLLAALVSLTAGCETYDIGDVSKRYCTNTAPEARKAFRVFLATYYPGMSMVNYCAMVGAPLVVAGGVISDVVDSPQEAEDGSEDDDELGEDDEEDDQ